MFLSLLVLQSAVLYFFQIQSDEVVGLVRIFLSGVDLLLADVVELTDRPL